MIRSIFIPLALAFTAPAAMAGNFYLNGEYNGSNTGNNFTGSTTDLHIGYEGDAGTENFNYYFQAGPTFIGADGQDSETELGGKLGGSFNLTQKLSAYGEFSFTTGEDDNTYGTKLGTKYAF
tara:strand:+ start:443 stop:808 length:366 start_codon:yes stop_codon:yes gene_type:complete